MEVKLIIPKKIVHKYRYLLTRFKNTEWSGPAFYRIKTDENGFPEEFKIVHFHPLDLGQAASTDFDAKDVAAILKETYQKYPSLKHCYMGLIHSHHTMGAFLSGTDKDTILDMAPVEGFYGSLVVASAGKASEAFGFSYVDQYGQAHAIIIDENNIEIQLPEYKVENDWVKQADIIEKNKPKTVATYGKNQTTLWKNYGNTRMPVHVNRLGTAPDPDQERMDILEKMPKKQRTKVEAILMKLDQGEITDTACEEFLKGYKISTLDILKLMDDGEFDNYGYGYGGYYG